MIRHSFKLSPNLRPYSLADALLYMFVSRRNLNEVKSPKVWAGAGGLFKFCFGAI
ncbi:hypothetical protein GCM10027278_20160 [Paralcaligenes ginsengisoli]